MKKTTVAVFMLISALTSEDRTWLDRGLLPVERGV